MSGEVSNESSGFHVDQTRRAERMAEAATPVIEHMAQQARRIAELEAAAVRTERILHDAIEVLAYGKTVAEAKAASEPCVEAMARPASADELQGEASLLQGELAVASARIAEMEVKLSKRIDDGQRRLLMRALATACGASEEEVTAGPTDCARRVRQRVADLEGVNRRLRHDWPYDHLPQTDDGDMILPRMPYCLSGDPSDVIVVAGLCWDHRGWTITSTEGEEYDPAELQDIEEAAEAAGDESK